MDVAEVEFLAEKELVTVIPNFSLDKIYLIGVSASAGVGVGGPRAGSGREEGAGPGVKSGVRLSPVPRRPGSALRGAGPLYPDAPSLLQGSWTPVPRYPVSCRGAGPLYPHTPSCWELPHPTHPSPDTPSLSRRGSWAPSFQGSHFRCLCGWL